MRDKKIWIFNAGNAFDGNPKWLFMYIVNYRKDITPYWFCYTEETRNYIRKLGYQAFLFKSKMAGKNWFTGRSLCCEPKEGSFSGLSLKESQY